MVAIEHMYLCEHNRIPHLQHKGPLVTQQKKGITLGSVVSKQNKGITLGSVVSKQNKCITLVV